MKKLRVPVCAVRCGWVHESILEGGCFLAIPDISCFSILDTDECASDKAVCPHDRRCVNTFGSYYCKCHVGFELKYLSGRYDCVGKNWWHLLFFSSPHQTCRPSLQIFWHQFSLLVEPSTVLTSLTTQKKLYFFKFLAFREFWWHELYEFSSIKI